LVYLGCSNHPPQIFQATILKIFSSGASTRMKTKSFPGAENSLYNRQPGDFILPAGGNIIFKNTIKNDIIMEEFSAKGRSIQHDIQYPF